MGELAELLARYRDVLARWGDESEVGVGDSVGRANRLFEQSHALFKVLRGTAGGRSGIVALMTDDDPYLRGTAAAHSLLWSRDAAIRVLEELEADDSIPWRMRIGAEYTLKEWRSGTLTHDW